jgi:hypothetical protein
MTRLAVCCLKQPFPTSGAVWCEVPNPRSPIVNKKRTLFKPLGLGAQSSKPTRLGFLGARTIYSACGNRHLNSASRRAEPMFQPAPTGCTK